MGDPRAPRSATGVQATFLVPRADVPSAGSPLVVWGVCTRGDLVCNVGRTGFVDAVRAHRSYAAGAGAAVGAKVATQMSARTSRWARPVHGLVASPGTAGTPMDQALPVLVSEGDAGHVVWSGATGLPPGLDLTSAGHLVGTPTQAGTWTVGYTVSNTGSAVFDHPVPGTFAVTVSAPSSSSRTLSAGGEHTCSVRSDGTLWCWGRNTWGAVGNGQTGPGPKAPARIGSSSAWSSVAAGGASTCGIRESGALFCWGLNNQGQVGDGTTKLRKSPVQIGSATDWSQVSLGWFTSCGLRTDGSAWCWGDNSAGQLAGASGGLRPQPTRIPGEGWSSISVGGWHVCGIKGDGTLWCWGRNTFGQVGNGTTRDQHSPVQIGKDHTWTQVSTSWSHTCGLKASGEVRCWGRNSDGQVGDGTRASRVAPTVVGGLPPMEDVAAGEGTTCSLDRGGQLWCWGGNTYGTLGNGTRSDSTVPVRGAGTFRTLSAGWMHMCAITGSGTSRCWGNNESGQVGDGTAQDAVSPTAPVWP